MLMHKGSFLPTAKCLMKGMHACAWHAAEKDHKRAALLKEFGDHLVALHIVISKATVPHHAEQYSLKMLLHPH